MGNKSQNNAYQNKTQTKARKWRTVVISIVAFAGLFCRGAGAVLMADPEPAAKPSTSIDLSKYDEVILPGKERVIEGKRVLCLSNETTAPAQIVCRCELAPPLKKTSAVPYYKAVVYIYNLASQKYVENLRWPPNNGYYDDLGTCKALATSDLPQCNGHWN